MVAISLYRGNLHKVPDVPRRWPPPTPKISTKNFKILIRRRARALSRLRSSTTDAAATTSNPKPNPSPDNSDPDPGHADNASENNDGGNNADNPCSEPELPPDGILKEGEEEKEKEEVKEVKDDKVIEDEDSLKKLVEKNDALVEEEGKELEVKDDKVIEVGDSLRKLMERTDALVVVEEEDKNGESVKNEEKKEVVMNPELEKSNTEDATIVEKRKKQVKERLEILNEKKHGLVQVLKQILNAEEQLKRQNSTQGTSGRPPLPLQVDVTTDSGSVTRVNTPRLGSDGNPCADTDGGEADDVSNHITHSRHLPRMSSTSPSSDSQQRKPASNMVPHSYRTTIGVAGSPSRFAPGGQGHSSVSVSGTSYIASSPSPAASGGTSVFRDARLPSPWN